MGASGHDSNPLGPLEKLLEAFKDKEFAPAPDNSIIEEPFRLPNRQKRLSKETKTQVVERYEAGETVLSLASAFRIHRSTVFVILKKAAAYQTQGEDQGPQERN